MKIRNCKILSAGILLVFTIGTTACNSGNGEQVYLHNSDAFIENHISGNLDYESISYEEYAGAGVMSMGPHEPLYRGVITAVEYGKNFTELLRKKFKDYEKFSVETCKFEDVEMEANSYDLVFSATAFHWVPEDVGYPKVFSMLKIGGAFARFANRPRNSQDDPELAREIDEIYNDHYNKYYGVKSGTKKWFTEENAREISHIPTKYGFTDIKYFLFHRERIFTAEEYVQLLGTYSDHIAIVEKIRNEFFSKIEDAINRHGGKITISDTLDLELARKQ